MAIKKLNQLQKLIILFIGVFFIIPSVNANGMQKLIILPFKNIDNDPNYQYLESTITDAIRKNLKSKFVFSETNEREWRSVMRKNFLYEGEAYTAGFGMNLGLASNQDVVINGGFYIKSGTNDESSVKAVVRVISITDKKIISEDYVVIPADNQLFSKIGEIADLVAKKAAKVLPNKEDWEKNKSRRKAPKKIFSNFSLGIFGGANFLIGGWADQFSPKLPAFSAILKANMPIVWDRFFMEFYMIYYSHELKQNSKTYNYYQSSNLNLTATNYVIGGYMGVDFPIGSYFYLSPMLGGGIVIQDTQISGTISSNVSNNFPFAGAGFDFGFILNDTFRIVLNSMFLVEIEDPVLTYMPVVQLGLNIKF